MFNKNKFLLALLISITLIFVVKPLYSTAQSLLILSDKQEVYPLGLYLQILEDPTKQLSLADVSSPEMSSAFQPSVEDIPNYGFTNSVYWVRLTLANNTLNANNWWLEIDFPSMRAIDVYQLAPTGELLKHKKGGTRYPISSRDMVYHTHLLELPFPPNTSQTLYMRFESNDSLRLPLTLYTPRSLSNKIRLEQLRLGAYYGILLIIIIYNLFLYLGLTDKNYLYFTLFALAFMVASFSLDGFITLFAGPDLLLWSQYFVVLFSALSGIFAFQFTTVFLRTREYLPNWHKLIIGAQLGLGAIIILIPFVPLRIISPVMLISLLLSFLIILIIGLFAWQRGHHLARYFVLGWAVFFMGMANTILARLGLFSVNIFNLESPRLAVISLFILLSLALVDRINLFKETALTANRNLQESEQRLFQFLEAMPIGITIRKVDTSLYYINKLGKQLLGVNDKIEKADFPGDQNVTDLKADTPYYIAGTSTQYPHEKLPPVQALQGQSQSVDDLEIQLPDRRLPLEISASPIFDESNQVQFVISAFQDITERKEAEHALRQSEARLKAIINNIPFDLWVCDAEGRYILQNAVSRSLAGDLTGKTIDDLDLSSEDKATYKAKHQRALQGETVRDEVVMFVKGKRLTVDSVQTPIFDDGQIIGFVGMNIDVTERKETEEALKVYATELERSNRELQNFAYVSSHDLQEPLRKIQAFGNRLESKYSAQLDEVGRDYLQRMQKSAARMQRLIQDLLSFSRVTNSTEPFVLIDLQVVLNGVLSDLETQIERVNGAVTVSELPQIEADETQMRQLFQNLISNSLKFHRIDTPPVVQIKSQPLSEGANYNQWHQISVKDNGIGFNEKYTDKVFGVFQRLHNRDEYEGTGVGLAICRRVVERHQGTISVYSQPNIGTEFVINLPAQQKQ